MVFSYQVLYWLSGEDNVYTCIILHNTTFSQNYPLIIIIKSGYLICQMSFNIYGIKSTLSHCKIY
jgi:hypothetical protein